MKATMLLRAATLALAAGTAGCAAAAPGGTIEDAGSRAPATQGGAAAPGEREGALVPAGFGSLRLDEVSLVFRTEDLQVRVTPLDEAVIRLAAPDIYERLSAAARAATARGAADEASLFLVSFFSDRPAVSYVPEQFQLLVQGRQLSAARILPTTPGWTRQRLEQQEQQSAVYAFEEDVDLEQGSIMARYGSGQSDDWSRIVPRLQVERSRARARAGGGGI